MGSAGEDIKAGVQNTDKDQAASAIAAQELMRQRLIEALDRGDWVKGLQEAGHEKWARNMVDKGIGKITTGIDANKTEIIAKFEKVDQVGKEVRSATKNMPKGSIDDSLGRVRKSMEIQKDRWGKT
jgi:t-SNARE complex subunit (syntaxin)